MNEIDRARKELGFPLETPPKFASLPTTDINAYTYPATGSTDSVIAFNTQLFMFDYQMTKVTLPTIAISNDPGSGKMKVDHSGETAVKAIATNPDLKTNFVYGALRVSPASAAFDATIGSIVHIDYRKLGALHSMNFRMEHRLRVEV